MESLNEHQDRGAGSDKNGVSPIYVPVFELVVVILVVAFLI